MACWPALEMVQGSGQERPHVVAKVTSQEASSALSPLGGGWEDMMRSKPGIVGALSALKRPEMEAFPSTRPSDHGRETWENFRHLL